jgi:hypothetical protein
MHPLDASIMFQRLNVLDQGLAERAKDVYYSAIPKLSKIVVTFPHYTAHDITHSLKTLEICEWLAGLRYQ